MCMDAGVHKERWWYAGIRRGHIRRGGGMLGYAGAHEVVVCWDTQGHIRRGGGMLGYAGAHKER